MISQIEIKEVKKEIARKILYDLPEWFGMPKYTEEYIEKSSDMPFFAAMIDNEPIGFAALKETSPYTAEIYCMGILKTYHHKGHGKEIFKTLESFAVKQGYKFLQVKTVKQGKYDIYDKTNAFYKAMGFYELEVFPTLWDEWNPCQVFVKSLSE